VTTIEGAIQARYPIDGQPIRVWFVNDDNMVVVLSAEGFVSFIDLETEDITQTKEFATATSAGKMTKDEQFLLVWSYYSNTLHFISVPEQKHVAKVTVGRNIGQVEFISEGKQAVITAVGSRQISVVDIETQEIVRTHQMDKAIGHLAISEDQVWMVASGGVYRSRERTGSDLVALGLEPSVFGEEHGRRALPISHHPRGIDTLEKNGQILVADRENSAILSLNILDKDSSIERLDLGRRPERIYRTGNPHERMVLTQGEAVVDRIIAKPEMPMVHDGRVWLSGSPWGLFPFKDSKWMLATIPGREIISRRYHGGPKVIYGLKARDGQARDSIALINTQTMREVDLIQTDEGPIDIAISKTQQTLAVACASANRVDIIH
jgi:hypothetical protein